MFHIADYKSKQKGFSFISITKSITSTFTFVSIDPGYDKLKEIVDGSVILNLVSGNCLLLLNGDTIELPYGPVVLDNGSIYALKNISKQKAEIYIDFIQ